MNKRIRKKKSKVAAKALRIRLPCAVISYAAAAQINNIKFSTLCKKDKTLAIVQVMIDSVMGITEIIKKENEK